MGELRKWLVRGADRETGAEIERMFMAVDRDHAEGLAQSAGMLVSDAVGIDEILEAARRDDPVPATSPRRDRRAEPESEDESSIRVWGSARRIAAASALATLLVVGAGYSVWRAVTMPDRVENGPEAAFVATPDNARFELIPEDYRFESGLYLRAWGMERAVDDEDGQVFDIVVEIENNVTDAVIVDLFAAFYDADGREVYRTYGSSFRLGELARMYEIRRQVRIERPASEDVASVRIGRWWPLDTPSKPR